MSDAPSPRSSVEPGSPPDGLSATWEESFRDLEEIARSVELDGAVPGEATLSATRRFLSALAARGLRAPIVGELSDHGIAVEFPGGGTRTRLTFVIEDDGSVAYYELIEGRRRRQRFPTVDASLSAVWPSSFRRAGFLVE